MEGVVVWIGVDRERGFCEIIDHERPSECFVLKGTNYEGA